LNNAAKVINILEYAKNPTNLFQLNLLPLLKIWWISFGGLQGNHQLLKKMHLPTFTFSLKVFVGKINFRTFAPD